MQNTFGAPVALLAALALGACSTLNHEPPPNRISNGEYHVYIYPGNLPHVPDSSPAEWGAEQGDQMVYLDRDCRVQMAPQVPSTLKSVGTTTLRTAIPIAVGGAIGTAEGIGYVTSATSGYATYGAWSAGGSGAGAGLGGGIDRHFTGDRYTQAGCMSAAVSEAKNRDGALTGINIVFNADAVNGHSLKRPVGGSPPVTRPKSRSNEEDPAQPPHP